MTVDDCRPLVSRWLAGDLPSEELKPDRDDCAVFRVRDGGTPVILKLWSNPGWRGIARRLSRTSPMQKELRALAVLGDGHLAVPRVLGAADVSADSSRWTEALMLEDLGECTLAMVHTKRLVQNGEEEALERYMGEVLDLTEGMLRLGVIDTDHSLQNLVANADGRAYRIDFELARVVRRNRIRPSELGLVLAHLIGSYVFAIQPEVERAVEFARQVQERLQCTPEALAAVSAEVRMMMKRQLDANGTNTRVTLPWEP